VKPCSLKNLLPDRRQNQCVSHHSYRRQKNDDDETCNDGVIASSTLPLAIVQATRVGKIIC